MVLVLHPLHLLLETFNLEFPIREYFSVGTCFYDSYRTLKLLTDEIQLFLKQGQVQNSRRSHNSSQGTSNDTGYGTSVICIAEHLIGIQRKHLMALLGEIESASLQHPLGQAFAILLALPNSDPVIFWPKSEQEF